MGVLSSNCETKEMPFSKEKLKFFALKWGSSIFFDPIEKTFELFQSISKRWVWE
jgi:hypothetical protein